MSADGSGDFPQLWDAGASHLAAPPFEVPFGDDGIGFLHDLAEGNEMIDGLASLESSGARLTASCPFFVADLVFCPLP